MSVGEPVGDSSITNLKSLCHFCTLRAPAAQTLPGRVPQNSAHLFGRNQPKWIANVSCEDGGILKNSHQTAEGTVLTRCPRSHI